MRKHKNVDLVADIQESLTSKNARIAAKKISQKYKKMRSKRTPIPFNLARLADTESVTSANDTNLTDVTSSKGAAIPAKKYLKNIKR